MNTPTTDMEWVMNFLVINNMSTVAQNEKEKMKRACSISHGLLCGIQVDRM